MTDIVSFRTEDQPEVEVLWEGAWCFGLLAEWVRGADARWVGTVRFNVKPGENRMEAFDQDRIRLASPPTPQVVDSNDATPSPS